MRLTGSLGTSHKHFSNIFLMNSKYLCCSWPKIAGVELYCKKDKFRNVFPSYFLNTH